MPLSLTGRLKRFWPNISRRSHPGSPFDDASRGPGVRNPGLLRHPSHEYDSTEDLVNRWIVTREIRLPLANPTLNAAGVDAGSRLANIIEGRADITALTQSTPEPHSIRAMLAVHTDDKVAAARLADPVRTDHGNPRDVAIIWHVDLVTQSPKRATSGAIDALRQPSWMRPILCASRNELVRGGL